jgi:UMF1 family MFS transporter
VRRSSARIADHRAMKKSLLALFLMIGAAATLMMATSASGQWRTRSVLFIVGNIGVAVHTGLLRFAPAAHRLARRARSRVDRWLRDRVHRRRPVAAGQPRVDSQPGHVRPSGTVAAIKLSLVSVGIWWVVFSIPLFRFVREPAISRTDRSALICARDARDLAHVSAASG